VQPAETMDNLGSKEIVFDIQYINHQYEHACGLSGNDLKKISTLIIKIAINCYNDNHPTTCTSSLHHNQVIKMASMYCQLNSFPICNHIGDQPQENKSNYEMQKMHNSTKPRPNPENLTNPKNYQTRHSILGGY
jgi:hypothetical protein